MGRALALVHLAALGSCGVAVRADLPALVALGLLFGSVGVATLAGLFAHTLPLVPRAGTVASFPGGVDLASPGFARRVLAQDVVGVHGEPTLALGLASGEEIVLDGLDEPTRREVRRALARTEDATRFSATLAASAEDAKAGVTFSLVLSLSLGAAAVFTAFAGFRPGSDPAREFGGLLVVGTLAALAHLGAFAAARALRRPEVVIADDGLRAGGVTIPYARIASERLVPDGLELVLTNGHRRVLRTRAKGEPPVAAGGAGGGLARELLARVGAARARALGLSPVARELVGRGGRDPATWGAALRGLAPEAGYRGEGVDDAALEALVRDASTPLDARVGAAAALASRAGGAARVRVLADAALDERVRVALDDVVDAGPEEALRRLAGTRDDG